MAETHDLTLAAEPQEGAVGWVTFEGSMGNKVLHSGPRLGGTVFPAAQVVTLIGLGVSVASNMKKTKELERTKKALSNLRKKTKAYSPKKAKTGGYPRPG